MINQLENQIISDLKNLFFSVYQKELDIITELPSSGSARKYFRLSFDNESIIGTYNNDLRENTAFIAFTEHFNHVGLPVPKILGIDLSKNIYLQNDLGDTSLYEMLQKLQTGDEFPMGAIGLYKKAIEHLVEFQIKGHQGLDYSVGYPRQEFDKQSMLWDLNYFKHYFIKLAGISFYEQDLENDFHHLADYLLTSPNDFFLFRDFQSRNIMVKGNDLFFIDYQGGRRGALQYDIASLLYDAKANIPNDLRSQFLHFYIKCLEKHITVNKPQFLKFYYGFALIRILQAFGAYGYRGFFERKLHFLQSIPYGIKNLQWIVENVDLGIELPSLYRVFKKIIESRNLKDFEYVPSKELTILINSFSYKRSLPLDNSGNGGGFVFDCRFLPNPGREETYRYLTGNDQKVAEYLESFTEVNEFKENVHKIIEAAISNYIERDFNHLMVSFGCTGGQHRSVYFANELHRFITAKYDVKVNLRHIEQEIKGQQKS